MELNIGHSADFHSWSSRAACKNLDTDNFYPSLKDQEAVDEAKIICGGCDVRRECLNYALAHGEKDGIWGGTDEIERRRIIRQRRRMVIRSSGQVATNSVSKIILDQDVETGEPATY